jgi:hypothetical protein
MNLSNEGKLASKSFSSLDKVPFVRQVKDIIWLDGDKE